MKKLKVENNQGMYSIDFSSKQPSRVPDWESDFGGGDLWEYWFKEMFAVCTDRLAGIPISDCREYYALAVCPRTKLLMYLEKDGAAWTLDLEEAQQAYINWDAERLLLGETKKEKKI